VQSAAGAPAPQQRAQPIVSNPRLLVEREALKLAVQSPVLAGPVFDAVDQSFYIEPSHQAIRVAIAEVGGAATGVSGAGWINAIRDACPDLAVQMLVMELAVDPVRYDGEPDSAYLNIVLARLQLAGLKQRIDEVKSKLQRINPVSDKEEYHRRFSDLLALEQHSRALKEQAAGGL